MENTLNILLIDDDDDAFIIYNKILKDHLMTNFNFEHVNTANKIKETISTNNYDIIILDQKLDNGNKGLDFLPIIKQNNIYTYVIINSAYGSENLAINAIRNGADNYICGNKDDNEEFIKVINQAIMSVNKIKKIEIMSQKFSNQNNELEKRIKEKKIILTILKY